MELVLQKDVHFVPVVSGDSSSVRYGSLSYHESGGPFSFVSYLRDIKTSESSEDILKKYDQLPVSSIFKSNQDHCLSFKMRDLKSLSPLPFQAVKT
jgi:hypothetical protein